MLLLTPLSVTVVLISITDVNDNDPEFMQDSYSIILFENSTIGTTDSTLVGEATDDDSGSNAMLSYSVAGTSKTCMDIPGNFKCVTSYVIPPFSFV